MMSLASLRRPLGSTVLATVALCLVTIDVQAQRSLSLEETLTWVLEANLRLESSRLEHAVAEERRMAEWGIFEPRLLLSAAREANNRQNTVEQNLRQSVSEFHEKNDIFSAAIESILPTGGSIRLGTQMRGLENNLQYRNGLPIGDEWDSFSGVTLTQPLLRDRGWSAVAAQIKLAAADSAIVFQELRGQMALVLSEAELAYWDVIAADELIDYRRQSLQIAESMLEDNRNRVRAGRMTEIEVLQAEAGVALRRSHLADAIQRRTDAASRLDAFLGRQSASAEPLTLTEELDLSITAAPDLVSAIQKITELHPAVLAQNERLEQAGVRVAYARNQRLPQVDLKASYGLNGLGHNWSNSYERAFNPAFTDRDYDSWFVGLEVSVPVFGGKREKHQHAAAVLRNRQALEQLSSIELELMNGIQALVARVDSQLQRVEALERVVEVQEQVLQAQEEWLEAGRSDSRSALEVEEDLSDARVEALQARLDLRRAMVELLVQQGSYLMERNLDLLDEQ